METLQNRQSPTKLMATLPIALSWLIAGPSAIAASTNLPPPLPPSGLFQYEFRAEGGPALWNFSGLYALPPYGAVRWHQSPRGAMMTYYATGDTASVQLKGTLTGAGSALKLRLASTVGFSEYNWQSDSWATRADRLALIFEPTNRAFTGIDRVTRTYQQVIYYDPNSFWEGSQSKIVKTRSSSVQPITLATPETTDGNWTLSLEIVPVGNRFTGTASIMFSNGETNSFQLLGSYSPKTGQAKLLLTGSGADAGANLRLTVIAPEMHIQSMRGAVGGQRVRFP